MEAHNLMSTCFSGFYQYLKEDEREPATIEKYLRDVHTSVDWLGEQPVCKETVSWWKEHLQKIGHQPVTVNGKLSALNKFFTFLGWTDCRVKYLKVQHRMFRNTEKELSREDYTRLLDTAHSLGRERLALLMETICATGIRVSEVQYITVEAIQAGRPDIALKGKIRTILLPTKCLQKRLLNFADRNGIRSGPIFLTRDGRPMHRTYISGVTKPVCEAAQLTDGRANPKGFYNGGSIHHFDSLHKGELL